MGKTHAAKAEDERDTDVCINKGEQRMKTAPFFHPHLTISVISTGGALCAEVERPLYLPQRCVWNIAAK
jgi:hypothetical protein